MSSGPAPSRRRRTPDEGSLEVFVADEQRDHPVDVARWSSLAADVLEACGVRGDAELSVLFVDEVAMAELNRRFMGAEGPTDVLSFPIDDDVVEVGRSPDSSTTGPDRPPATAGEAPVLLGDVVVCPAVAARQAPGHAGSFDDEVALLVVHGILHVLGMDHAEDGDREAMQRRERELLERFHGPLGRDPWRGAG